MQSSISVAKKISKDLGKNWLSELENYNLSRIFMPVYLMENNIETLNTITAFVIFAYDNDSQWIELKKDRITNKQEILIGLGADLNEDIWQSIINNENDEILSVIAEYLKSITTWKWKTIISCFDYHSTCIQKASEQTKSADELEAAKINKEKGGLLKLAIQQREVGEQLLKELKSEYVKTDHATQNDFGFQITDEKAIDVTSWRERLRLRIKTKQQQPV